ncbi:MAG: AMP-binding protein, partial [Streptosporangiaceae bacterium]
MGQQHPAAQSQELPGGRGYGAILATPTQADIEQARITDFARWLAQRRGDGSTMAPDYHELWRWSVADPADFWSSIWEYFAVPGGRGNGSVLEGGPMPAVRWFSGSTLNYAHNALRAASTDPDRTAIIYRSEAGHEGSLSYAELDEQVAIVRAALIALGVQRGDRVAALLPNSPQALIGLLATASLGAIWTSCSPDFGAHAVIDRFAQVTPKVLIAVDGYAYGGKKFDRQSELAAITRALPGLQSVIMIDYVGSTSAGGSGGSSRTSTAEDQPALPVPTTTWSGLAELAGPVPEPGPSGLRTECDDVPFEHPLWVLYSSGTTGL